MAFGDLGGEITAAKAGAMASGGHSTRTNAMVCEADVEAGRFMTQGASENSMKLPTSDAEVLACVGITVYYPNKVDLGAAGEHLAANEHGDVLEDGEIWVETEEAVDKGGAVFVRHTANGGNTTLGIARSDADTDNAGPLPRAKFTSSTAAAGLTKVRISLP